MVSIKTLKVEEAVSSILRLLNPDNLENLLMVKKPSELIAEIKKYSVIVFELLIEVNSGENDGVLNYKAQGKHLSNSLFIMKWGFLHSSVQSMEEFSDTMYHTNLSFVELLKKFYNDIKNTPIWVI